MPDDTNVPAGAKATQKTLTNKTTTSTTVSYQGGVREEVGRGQERGEAREAWPMFAFDPLNDPPRGQWMH